MMASVGEKDESTNKETTSGNGAQTIVQYILVRTDLKWSTGAMIAQACHASTASIAGTLNNSATKDYLSDLGNMHKVILKTDRIEDLISTESTLKEANIAHCLWIEKPENIATCLACSPQPRTLVQTFFKHFKLLR